MAKKEDKNKKSDPISEAEDNADALVLTVPEDADLEQLKSEWQNSSSPTSLQINTVADLCKPEDMPLAQLVTCLNNIARKSERQRKYELAAEYHNVINSLGAGLNKLRALTHEASVFFAEEK
jgi:ssRNA-specific RNase YbeY (16S rRNA maturation enzyme)